MILPVLIALVVGMLAGAALVVLAIRTTVGQQETALAILKHAYRRTHAHWLHRAKDDPTPVCPCCGWSEREALASRKPTV